MFLILSSALAVSPAADPRPFWSLFGHRDTDDDGVRDKNDTCGTLPETVNGYQDGDGCPDRLTSVTVGAWYAGQPVPDATLTAQVEGRFKEGRGELLVEDLHPDATLYLTARTGCLTSQAELPLAEEAQRVRLRLHPTGSRPVNVFVVDATGKPLPMTTVQWVSTSEPGCGASVPVLLDDGQAQLKLGDGDHEVEVNYRGRRQKVMATLRPNDNSLVLQLRDRSGRAAQGELLPEKVYFKSGRAKVQSSADPMLDRVAQLLSAEPSSTLILEGHADERGFDTYNMDLSRRRAEAVRAALLSRGVDPARLRLEALGESEPVADGYSSTSLSQNRRVQFRVVRPRVTAVRVPPPTPR